MSTSSDGVPDRPDPIDTYDSGYEDYERERAEKVDDQERLVAWAESRWPAWHSHFPNDSREHDFPPSRTRLIFELREVISAEEWTAMRDQYGDGEISLADYAFLFDHLLFAKEAYERNMQAQVAGLNEAFESLRREQAPLERKPTPAPAKRPPTGFLSSRDLAESVAAGDEKEIERIEQAVNRWRQNNPGLEGTGWLRNTKRSKGQPAFFVNREHVQHLLVRVF